MFFFLAARVHAQTTNLISTVPPLANAGASFIRVLGALALVLGVFLGGVWLFKNWQRLANRTGHTPKLNLVESRSLGARQGIFVIGYDKQRFLVASSPTGVNLLSHLPDAEISETETQKSAPMPFAQALAAVLKGK
jgi:flagellar biogenesis protein FliO